MFSFVSRVFGLEEAGTTIGREAIAGVTTFLTMSYIIFVQPTVLKAAGMDIGSVMVATCVSSFIATILMAFLANYPIALAPGMGENFFFAFTLCGSVSAGGLGYSWQVALGANFIAGVFFVFLSRWGLRETIMNGIPDTLKHSISVGIGLLIAFLGFEWGGLVVPSPGTFVTLGKLGSKVAIVTLCGVIFIATLQVMKVKGAIFWGILASGAAAVTLGIVSLPTRIISAPPSLKPTFFKLDVLHVFKEPDFIVVIFIFLFLDLFDTIGTLIGVAEKGNLMKDGKLPRARQALLSDALGTVVGTVCGTSTVTSFVESTAGVSVGGRTGLASVFTGVLFLVALFFSPIVKMVGGGASITVSHGQTITVYPIIAPALIIVGVLMFQGVKRINWSDITDAIPAFLTMVIMQFAFSITEGIAFGFISYSFLKIISGKFKEVNPVVHVFAVLFILRYLFLNV